MSKQAPTRRSVATIPRPASYLAKRRGSVNRVNSVFIGTLALLLGSALPVAGQIGVVVRGRVEDAVSRVAVVGARVAPPDSTPAVFTDSSGEFALLIPTGTPLSLYVEQYGYMAQDFALGQDAPSQISVLLLAPAPIELEGITVVEEAALTQVLDGLRRRRAAYGGTVTTVDHEGLRVYAAGRSLLDYIQMTIPGIFYCGSGRSGLCVPGRDRTFRSQSTDVAVRVCIDSWESWGADSELETLPIESVAMVEIYSRGRGGIRVYTSGYLASTAASGSIISRAVDFGC